MEHPRMDHATLAFLGGLAHELRTPLGGIGGYAELLELGVYGPVSPKQADGLARIRRNQQLMVDLLGAFMAYAEVAAGVVTLAPTTVALHASVASAIRNLDERAEALDVRVVVASGSPVPDVQLWGDAGAIEGALTELLRDAVESSTAGTAVTVELSVSDRMVHVEVRSTADPLDRSAATHAFVPFSRDGRGKRSSAARHALSLPHARLLALALGGDLEVQPSDSIRALRISLPRQAPSST